MFQLINPHDLAATGDHNAVTLGTAVFSPSTPPGGANYLMVQAVTQNVRYTLTVGVNPAATIGFQLVASAAPIIIALGRGVNPRFIREAAGAILQYQWLE